MLQTNKKTEELQIKNFYRLYAGKIRAKVLNSPYPLRNYVHRTNYFSILKHINPGERVLEVGCGEGILSILVAKKGAKVIASDISKPNLESAKRYARQESLDNIEFTEADAENLPFKDSSFDLVIADNVLEHLPDFEKGLSEIKRVTKRRAIIVLPTCLNLCAFCLLGGDNFWKFSRRTPYAIFLGFFRVILGIFGQGVNESYGGKKELPHLWRYPWVMKKELKKAGFKIISFEPASICLPYVKLLLPLVKFLDKHKESSFLRNFGYGSIALVEKA